jgi:epoxyqueuosine reductase
MSKWDFFSHTDLASFNIVDFSYTQEREAKSYTQFKEWVDEGKHQPLGYLEGERGEIRKNVASMFPHFQSAIVFLFDYSSIKRELENFYHTDESNGLKISSYALGFEGLDYHHKIKESLDLIGEGLKKQYSPSLNYTFALDVHPVLERDLAHRSGLGFFGKNSMLINRHHGSFFIIGTLLLDQKLEGPEDFFDKKVSIERDHCGSCTRCIDHCPTDAIVEGKRNIIAEKCISTFTIELFKMEKEPPPGFEKANSEIFGCDICQDVCPWNLRLTRELKKNDQLEPPQLFKYPMAQKIIDFFLKRPVIDIKQDLENTSQRQYRKFFKGTALERTGKNGMLKNILSLKERS